MRDLDPGSYLAPGDALELVEQRAWPGCTIQASPVPSLRYAAQTPSGRRVPVDPRLLGSTGRSACQPPGATLAPVPVPSSIMAALSTELRRLEAVAARTPDPDDDRELERLVSPVRDELRRLADELEQRV